MAQRRWKSLWYFVLCGAIAACADEAVTSPPTPHDVPPPGNLSLLAAPTFDGSGEAVHPDPVLLPREWSGDTTRRYLVATPYPGGNARYENPSYYESISLAEWHPPEGVINPITQPVGGGYLSDPDHLYNPATNEIWLYYRQVTDANQILLIRSRDGVHWDSPTLVVRVANHAAISPTVVRRAADDWLMWTVNGGSAGCSAATATVELRRSADGLTWSAPTAVAIPAGKEGESPWHIDVTWVPTRGEFWALYNAKTPGSCTTETLWLATSRDGVTWKTAPTPLLARGVIAEFADVVYRASLLYDAGRDEVTLWYSGARVDRGTYIWRLATQVLARETLFAVASGTVQQPHVSLKTLPSTALQPPAPLTNETAP